MLSAVIVGMTGFHLLQDFGHVQLHAAEGSFCSIVIGGLIFGVGFALLGYCPETVSGAIGTGAVVALAGGMTGLVIGTGFFAELYPVLRNRVLTWGKFPAITVAEFLNLKATVDHDRSDGSMHDRVISAARISRAVNTMFHHTFYGIKLFIT